ncbi:MAG: DUF616 domain-containing protein [Bacteroidales bacterium]|nr:DUF616 domain-containing protein [Bacteroidales bacterium]
MNRTVVYTCITGGFDALPEVRAVREGVDFICFSDAALPEGSPWQYRKLAVDGLPPRLAARYHKLNPHLLFPEYERSVWLDGNVGIASDEFYDIIDTPALFAGLEHPLRDDVYEEAYACLRGERETFCRLLRAVRFLRAEGFPPHSGLLETNVLLRQHNSPEVIRVDELWWDMVRTLSERDQLSIMYCLREEGLRPELLLGSGLCARNHPSFIYTVHDKTPRRPLLRRKLHYFFQKFPRAAFRIFLALS